MQFWLLGPLEVSDGDRLLQLGGSKRRALLALLILNANEVISTDRLVAELWDAGVPGNAAGSIHNHVSRLRKELGPEIVATHRWGYVLRAEPESIDLRRFERAVAEADALPAPERASLLAEALSLWRGPPLADLACEPALSGHIARLEELRYVALERRIDTDLELGRDAELVGELEALVAGSPLRERLRSQLILALYRSGRQVEALEVYRDARRLLANELGLEPGPELRELERAVLRQDPALAARPTLPVAPDVPERRRRRARAAMVASLGLALLGGGGYALATAAWKSPAGAGVRVPVESDAPPVAHAAANRTPTTPAKKKATAPSPTRHSRARAAVRQSLVPPADPATTAARAAVRRTVLPGTTVVRAVLPKTTPPPANVPARTTTPTPAPLGPPTLADPRGWWTGGQREVTAAQKGGVLTIAVPATATDGFSRFVQTRCRAVGDFDAVVNFELVEWSGADGVWASLSASDLGGVNVYRTDGLGEMYGAYVPPSGGDDTPATGSRGALRLTRRGSEITGSYNDGSQWITIFSGAGPTRVTALALGVFNIPTVATFGGRGATVSFDSFTLSAGTLDC